MVAFEGDLCNIHREERDRNNRYYTLLIPGECGKRDSAAP